MLEETGTHVLHCPCCNAKLGSGIARVPEMLARGINVALGSDGAPSNNNLDMFIEMRLASLINKYRLGADAMPAAAVLRMTTKNGTKALNLGGDTFGSLEIGKKADLIINVAIGTDVNRNLVQAITSPAFATVRPFPNPIWWRVA